MTDESLARAREALRQAQVAAGISPQAAVPAILEALDRMALELARLEEMGRNLKVQQALLDDRLLKVERNRLFTAVNRMVSAAADLYARMRGGVVDGTQEDELDPALYARWIAHETAAMPSAEAARAASAQWAQQPTISIVTIARTGSAVEERLESLRRQAYDRWELCAAVTGDCPPLSTSFPAQVRIVHAKGIDDARALSAACDVATGEYLALLPGTGSLSPFALYYFAQALQQGTFDLLYSDEDSLDTVGRRVRPVFKPDWSPELLASTMYLGNLMVVRRESWQGTGGLSGDRSLHDLTLRLADRNARVRHIPRVLCHCQEPSADRPTRVAGRSRPSGEMTAIVCSKSPSLLETCLKSLRSTAGMVVRQIIVVAHEDSGANPELHAVIERYGAEAIRYQGGFHFAAMNNDAATAAKAPYLLFLNDDVRATEPGWAELLVEQSSREQVGAAGAVLRYPSGLLQHAGIVAGIRDGVGHVGRRQRASRLWPWLLATREVSAVTGACLAIRRELFARVGGFDRIFPNNYNDVDLCFRLRSEGHRVICVAAPGLIHAECQSRPGVVSFEERYRFYERWAAFLRSPDPYYSTSLAPDERITLNLAEGDWYRPLFGDQ